MKKIALLLICFLTAAQADNALPIGTHDLDGKTLTVFAHPVPLRAGPVQFAIMITDKATGQPDLRWKATGSLLPTSDATGQADWVPPCCRMKTPTGADGSIGLQFSDGSTGNALMRGSTATIPKSGHWMLNLDLELPDGPDGAVFRIAIGEPPAPLTRYWPWFASLPVAALAYLGSRKREPANATP